MSIISLEYNEIIDTKIEKKQIEFSEYLIQEEYNLDSLFITKVDGQSMQPVINNKALVVADLSQTVLILLLTQLGFFIYLHLQSRRKEILNQNFQHMS